MERDSIVGTATTLAEVTKRDRARPGESEADGADVAYAKRVLQEPHTEWVSGDDVKRELANSGD